VTETDADRVGLTGRRRQDVPPVLDAVPPVLTESVGFLLSKAADQIERRFAEALSPYAVSPRQYGVLASIIHLGPQSQNELGERLGIDRTSMVNLIDSLEAMNLVTRVRDRDDRRRYAITLSETGTALLRDSLMHVDDETHRRFLVALEPGEADQLLDMLRRLVQVNADETRRGTTRRSAGGRHSAAAARSRAGEDSDPPSAETAAKRDRDAT
jgi:DNA-binding MarR family transcriptional regulator